MSKFIKLIGYNTSVRDGEHEIWFNLSNLVAIEEKTQVVLTTEHDYNAYWITKESMQKLLELVGE